MLVHFYSLLPVLTAVFIFLLLSAFRYCTLCILSSMMSKFRFFWMEWFRFSWRDLYISFFSTRWFSLVKILMLLMSLAVWFTRSDSSDLFRFLYISFLMWSMVERQQRRRQTYNFGLWGVRCVLLPLWGSRVININNVRSLVHLLWIILNKILNFNLSNLSYLFIIPAVHCNVKNR